MRIVITTPLYPPEVAYIASYAKELARRLSKNHNVTVLAYAHIPEKIDSVQLITVNKRQPRLTRLWSFWRAFVRVTKDSDAVIVLNGASVELPLLLSIQLPPTLFIIADKATHEHSRFIERFARARAHVTIENTPTQKPEILPLEPSPADALAEWENQWHEHIQTLEKIFANYEN